MKVGTFGIYRNQIDAVKYTKSERFLLDSGRLPPGTVKGQSDGPLTVRLAPEAVVRGLGDADLPTRKCGLPTLDDKAKKKERVEASRDD